MIAWVRSRRAGLFVFDRTLPIWIYLSCYWTFSSNSRNTTIDITETKITPVHNEHTRSHSSSSTKLLFHFRFYCISEAHHEVSAEHYAAWVLSSSVWCNSMRTKLHPTVTNKMALAHSFCPSSWQMTVTFTPSLAKCRSVANITDSKFPLGVLSILLFLQQLDPFQNTQIHKTQNQLSLMQED